MLSARSQSGSENFWAERSTMVRDQRMSCGFATSWTVWVCQRRMPGHALEANSLTNF
jgi:hypothetical protein